MIDRDQIVSEDELTPMSTANCRPTAAARSRLGSRAHADDAASVAAWRKQAELIQRALRRRRQRKAAARGSTSDAWLTAAAMARSPRPPRLHLPLSWSAASPAGRCAASRRRHPSDLTRFTADALDAYRLYVVEVRHPVEVPGDQRPHLVEWLSKRVGSPLRAPELDKMGLKLVGGRLLPGPTGATAFFMYEGPSGERFTLYCGRTSDRETALRYTAGAAERRLLLGRSELAYVLSGPAEQRQAARHRASRLRSDRHAHAAAGRVKASRYISLRGS